MSSSLRFTSPNAMKEFFSEIRGAVVSTLVLAVVCCGLYPLVVFGISQALFHDKANGSLIVDQTEPCAARSCWPGIHRRQIFSSAPFRRWQRLRRREFQRQQSRPDFAKTERRDQGPHRRLPQGERLEGNRSRSRRCRHGVRQRPRSSHQPAQRRAANPARGQSSRLELKRKCASLSSKTPMGAISESSVTRRQCSAIESRTRSAALMKSSSNVRFHVRSDSSEWMANRVRESDSTARCNKGSFRCQVNWAKLQSKIRDGSGRDRENAKPARSQSFVLDLVRRQSATLLLTRAEHKHVYEKAHHCWCDYSLPNLAFAVGQRSLCASNSKSNSNTASAVDVPVGSSWYR